MNILLDLEGIIISNENSEILAVPTEIAYILFDNNNVIEAYTTRIKYDLRKYKKKYWIKSFKVAKKKFPKVFNNNIYSNYGVELSKIKNYLLELIKQYNITIYAKGINYEIQFLFGDSNNFHKSVKIKNIEYKTIDLNDLYFKKYDDTPDKEILILNFYKKNKKNIETYLPITKKELFEEKLNYYVNYHISILEVIVFYQLLKVNPFFEVLNEKGN